MLVRRLCSRVHPNIDGAPTIDYMCFDFIDALQMMIDGPMTDLFDGCQIRSTMFIGWRFGDERRVKHLFVIGSMRSQDDLDALAEGPLRCGDESSPMEFTVSHETNQLLTFRMITENKIKNRE